MVLTKINQWEVLAATSVTMATSATDLTTAGSWTDYFYVDAFVDDTGNAQNFTLYIEYSPDSGTTWFEDYNSQISGTAAGLYCAQFIGGFYSRLMGIKAVAGEAVVVSAYADKNPGMQKKVTLSAAAIKSAALSPGTALYTSAAQDDDCDYVIVYVDDNGNANNLTCTIYLSDDQGTSYFIVGTVAVHSAADRRAAIVIRKNGLYCKVIGVKAVGAENVIVTVEGRLRTQDFLSTGG